MILVVKKDKEIDTPSLNKEEYEIVTLSTIIKERRDVSQYKAIVILGGDGTILRTIHYTKSVPPLFPFNFGTLGYLTTFTREDSQNIPKALEEHTLLPRKRLLLRDNLYFLNEAVFTSQSHRLNTFTLRLLGKELILQGDALLVSTPSGSTGYNHSVGGPTLLCDSIVINLVAPNKCNFRPLVVGIDTQIEVENKGGLVICDGVEYKSQGETITYDGNEVMFGGVVKIGCISSYTTLHYSTLLYTTLHYSTLLYTTLHYSILFYFTLFFFPFFTPMEYEKTLGIFSPDGRLIQVEYAQQASEQGSLVVFSSVPGKICVSIEVKSQNRMLVDSMKLFRVDSDQNIWMSYSGLKPDSDKVLDCARIICRNNKLRTGEDISIDRLAYELSKFKQKYTLGGGMRPLGIRTVLFYVGDSTKVIVVEPDGNYSEWASGAVGQKSVKVCDFIEKNMSDDPVTVSVSALGTVVQSDRNKVMSYLIQKDGIKTVDGSAINDLIKKISV